MKTNYCVEFLNNSHGAKVTEEVKQTFIAELKKLHNEGNYVVPTKDGGWKISNKKPETLAKQIKEFDNLIAMTFQKL